MMESSESLTPPGSPVLGYSGSRTSLTPTNYSSPNESGLSTESIPVYHFSCKGPILNRTSDHCFSSNGLFLRNQALAAIKLLKRNSNNNLDDGFFSSPRTNTPENVKQPVKYIIFGHKFDPFDQSSTKHSIGSKNNNSNPYKIRHSICEAFSILVTHRTLLLAQFDSNDENIVMSDQNFHLLFNGLRKCLGTVVGNWSSTLKYHCGSKDGNECTSPDYHLFHLNLEIRWSLVLISGLNANVLNWIFQDLLELSLLKYQATSQASLEGVTPFNCYCVKEFWCILRVVIDRVNPQGKQFWDYVISNLSIKSTNLKSFSFPFWLLSHLVSLYDYELNGVYLPMAGILDEDVNNSTRSSSCYIYINQLIKKRFERGDNVAEITQYVRRFIPYWGFDLEIFTTFWAQLLPRLDKGFEMDSMRHYSSAIKWYNLISLHIGKDVKETLQDKDDILSSDPFLEFLNLLYIQIKSCSIKDWRKLKSSLCNRLTPKIVGSLKEFGLARVATLYLVLAYGTDDCLALCQRLNETLDYTKDLFLHIKLRARCTMILLLLKKSINATSICEELMKSIDEFIITSTRNAGQKDLVMIYIETLEHLTSFGSELNLGQSQLIPSNLTVWLTTCGHNYVIRTLQSLHKLFECWILKDSSCNVFTSSSMSSTSSNNNDKAIVAEIIEKKTLQFIKQSVSISQQQQFSNDFDFKPFADLAADFTIVHGLLQHLYMNAEVVGKLFEYFAVNDKTCPNVSERFVSQIIKSKWSWNGIISDNLLLQAWIKLTLFNYDIPLQLSVHVLSLNNNISFPSITTKTESLLLQFCEIVNNSEDPYWNKNQLQILLGPCLAISRTIVTNSTSVSSSTSSNTQAENKLRIEYFIKSCSVILKQIKFEKIYIRQSQSFVQHIFDTFCPPFVGKLPWEKLPSSVVGAMRKYLPEFFISIVSYEPWKQDPYLKRKLSDIVRFSLLGYTNAEELESTNPGLVIMQYCEKQTNVLELLYEISSSFQNVTKEIQLTKKYLLTIFGLLKRHMIQSVVALIYSVLEILVEKEIEYTSICTTILSHVFTTIMSGRVHNCDSLKLQLITTLENIMAKHFSFRSKKFFDLFTTLTTSSSSTNNLKTLPLKQFIKFDVIPLVENYIHISEAKQGSGTNYTLRRQLTELEKRLTDVTR